MYLTLLHSERQRLYTVLAVVSLIGLIPVIMLKYWKLLLITEFIIKIEKAEFCCLPLY